MPKELIFLWMNADPANEALFNPITKAPDNLNTCLYEVMNKKCHHLRVWWTKFHHSIQKYIIYFFLIEFSKVDLF